MLNVKTVKTVNLLEVDLSNSDYRCALSRRPECLIFHLPCDVNTRYHARNYRSAAFLPHVEYTPICIGLWVSRGIEGSHVIQGDQIPLYVAINLIKPVQ